MNEAQRRLLENWVSEIAERVQNLRKLILTSSSRSAS